MLGDVGHRLLHNPVTGHRPRHVDLVDRSLHIDGHRHAGGSVLGEQTFEIVERRRGADIVQPRRRFAASEQTDRPAHLVEAVATDALGVSECSVGLVGVAAEQMTRRGGTTVFIGVPGFANEFRLPSMQLIMEDRTVKGSYYGSARVTRDFPRFIELIESGRLDVASMVTRRYPLDQVNDAFAAMRDGEVVRGVVVPN